MYSVKESGRELLGFWVEEKKKEGRKEREGKREESRDRKKENLKGCELEFRVFAYVFPYLILIMFLPFSTDFHHRTRQKTITEK